MNGVLGGGFVATRQHEPPRGQGLGVRRGHRHVLGAAGPRPYIAYAPVQTDKTAPSMAELRREMVEIRSTRPPEDDELARVMDEQTLSLPGSWETAGLCRRFARGTGPLRIR